MATYHSSQYYTSSAMPITGKDQAYPSYDGGYYPVSGGHDSYSVSPPESEVASSTSGALYSSGSAYSSGGYSSGGYSAGGYSTGYPSAAASYAGSTHEGDYDNGVSAYSASGVDFNEYVGDRMDEFRANIRLDTCLATQAKKSGSLNAKERQLLERTKKAQARIAKARANYAAGLDMARDVHSDLQWTHDSVSRSQAMASSKHSREYRKARAQYPEPEY